MPVRVVCAGSATARTPIAKVERANSVIGIGDTQALHAIANSRKDDWEGYLPLLGSNVTPFFINRCAHPPVSRSGHRQQARSQRTMRS